MQIQALSYPSADFPLAFGGKKPRKHPQEAASGLSDEEILRRYFSREERDLLKQSQSALSTFLQNRPTFEQEYQAAYRLSQPSTRRSKRERAEARQATLEEEAAAKVGMPTGMLIAYLNFLQKRVLYGREEQ